MKLVYKIFSSILFICFTIEFHSQGCSTCRAQIINSDKDDLTVGNGLNTGILFLMAIPYIILLCTVLWILYNSHKPLKVKS